MTNLPKIGQPATRALNEINVSTLEEVAQFDEQNLSNLHGVGPKAIRILNEALQEKGLNFNKLDEDLSHLKFVVRGDLNCDNAPKRRIVRDIVVGSTAGDIKAVESWLTDDLIWEVPGEFELTGKDAFIKQLQAYTEMVKSLEIKSILSHGKEASIHGTMIDRSGKPMHFAEMYEFASHKKDSKIKKITSYIMMKHD
ncbi:nuclear transport factor 2 family protein [Mammaliicoccus sp. Dog046]|uniref:nuclear transport factor 2 family protein n=1 Tax=Mammaliicoccus sp. Dog046 TaxID=3034233 RepID=UPI002B261FE6|nr:nuclear transport factor 2 family protein [Mammaliicoccus sp. Dog046]WQK85204.1 nuclear transport factor 2 family protein [Mammaliicoccus sp. Dog046]